MRKNVDDDPAKKRAKAGAAARAAIDEAKEELSDASIAKLAKAFERLLPKRPLPLRVLDEPEDDGEAGFSSWDRQLVDPAILELALAMRVPLRLPTGNPRSYTFWLYHWAKRDGGELRSLDELRLVGAHPFFGQVLTASFFPTRETKDEVGNWLARAVRCAGGGFDPVFAELDAFAAKMTETWTVGALEVHASWLEGLCQPGVFERCPALLRAIRELDPARLLRNQLRAGILDEWGWPAFEEALARVSPHGSSRSHEDTLSCFTSAPLPYGVVGTTSGRGAHLVAFGPEGIVADQRLPPPSRKTKPQKKASKKGAKASKEPARRDVRAAYWIGGDLLVCEYTPQKAQWMVSGGEPFAADPGGFFHIPHGTALVTKANTLLRPGSRDFVARPDGRGAGRRVWYDGDTYYDVTQEVLLRGDGTAKDEDEEDGFYRFDPTTGRRTGHALPPWMAKRVGPTGTLVVDVETTFVCPAPEGAEGSPLGAKDGLGGFVLYAPSNPSSNAASGDGAGLIAEGIDGRRANGLVNGLLVAALITFPERNGFYPVVGSAFDLGVAMPDGTTPLVPVDAMKGDYWAGTPPIDLLAWHSLRPRDRVASRALATCSYASAKAILDAPAADVHAISQALPAVKHPRMVQGVAGLARTARELQPVVARLQSRITPPRKIEEDSALRNADVAALSKLFDHETFWWVEKRGIQLGQQVLDASHFLLRALAAPGSERIVTPAPTSLPWELLVCRIGEVLYRVLSIGTPKAQRLQLVAVLELWRRTDFPAHADRLRLVQLEVPKGPDVAGLDLDHATRLVDWGGDRFFVRWRSTSAKTVTTRCLQAARQADAFRTPKGARASALVPADTRFGHAAIDETLALLRERGPVKFDATVVGRLAAKAKLSPAAAALLWTAGYDPWLTGEKKRERFGIDRHSLDQAEVELRKKRLRELYAEAMPDHPARMYDAPDEMVERVAAAWKHAAHTTRRRG